jgi:hypothetical protein
MAVFFGGRAAPVILPYDNSGFGSLPSPEEYEAHLRFQQKFSYTSLRETLNRNAPESAVEEKPPYSNYELDANGLYVEAEPIPLPPLPDEPYPFAELRNFLDGQTEPQGPLPVAITSGDASGLLNLLIACLLSLAVYIRFA